MSLLLRTIEAFPRGRTTTELLALLGVDFDADRRAGILGELEDLVRQGLVCRERSGHWRPLRRPSVRRVSSKEEPHPWSPAPLPETETLLRAAAFTLSRNAVRSEVAGDDGAPGAPDPIRLLHYWRSALRSDPRGAITQTPERHATDWQILTGRGPVAPEENEAITLTIRLDDLAPTFREALQRRLDSQNALALGWPLATGRRSGAPVVWPVGLLAASWRRDDETIVVTIEADDLLINPDWVASAAAGSSWSRSGLEALFSGAEGAGLPSAEFLTRLREAVARSVVGRLNGRDLVSDLDPASSGIHDAAALFLPTDTPFTAGAARDLDAIASWPKERIEGTALGAALGFHRDAGAAVASINVGPLNGEKIAALRHGCTAPLSVVTGPPGTGKSQTIVSLAAAQLAEGGSVLVASKNHQALDAVQERLGALAPSLAFIVRTLDPSANVDRSARSVLNDILEEPTSPVPAPSPTGKALLERLALERATSLDRLAEEARRQSEIAMILEDIAAREALDTLGGSPGRPPAPAAPARRSWLTRLMAWVRREGGASTAFSPAVDSLPALQAKLQVLRKQLAEAQPGGDPVSLTHEIASAAAAWLPRWLAHRTAPQPEARQQLAEAAGNFALQGSNHPLPERLAAEIVGLRPLWLASVLGAPRRIPLHPALFDLLIVDEASQCDIASALPLFARAKRAVVVGDDKQLSFIPQIGLAHDRNLMQKHELPLGRMGRFAQSRLSLFDFASRVPRVPRTLLRDQYRSAGPIVDYISGQFYGGRLRVAHDPAGLKVPAGAKPGIEWTDVPGPRTSPTGNVNHAEVEAIATQMHRLLVEQDYGGTVGVMSPFRSQVAALFVAITERIPATIRARADLRVSTVDGFQGQERELILFSPCVCATSADSARSFISRDWRRLNVAVSRARAVTHVFGDLEFARSNAIRSLARLAAAATEPRARRAEGGFDSEWERLTYYALKRRGLEPVPQYEIAGRSLDFALFGANGVKLDLEVDGRFWHADIDGGRKIQDHWRDHLLRSLGWRVRRFWVDELSKDLEGCLDLVERDLL